MQSFCFETASHYAALASLERTEIWLLGFKGVYHGFFLFKDLVYGYVCLCLLVCMCTVC